MPTVAAPDTAEITCSLCPRPLNLNHETLRVMIDAGVPPVCQQCAERIPRTDKPSIDKATKKVKLLWAAWNHARDGIITLGELSVVAWKRFPEAFGLPGFTNVYPDSNRVCMEVVKMDDLGQLESAGPRQYRVTAAGLKLLNQYEG